MTRQGGCPNGVGTIKETRRAHPGADSASPPKPASMASIRIADDTLHVDLRLWDRILAIHGSLDIPLEHVKSATAGPAPPVPWLRAPGTGLPGVVIAGSFWSKESGWAFYDYHGSAGDCLILELDHEHYSRAVVEIDPPQTTSEAAAQITAALSQRSAP
jgi:hypothetical protein